MTAGSTATSAQEDLIETVRCTEGDGSSVDLPGHGASGLPEGLTLVEVVELLLMSFVDAAVLRLVADVETRYPELSRHAEDLPKEDTTEDLLRTVDLTRQHDAGRRRRARQELMHPYSSAEWESLFLAEAGASAALAGLLFVALSINLERILKGAGLLGRAGEAIVLLLTVLVVSTWVLVPGQSPKVLGAELLGSGLFAWLILVAVHIRAVRGHVAPSRRLLIQRIVLAHAAVLPLLVGGMSLMLRVGGGLYWLVPGVLLCLLVAVVDAWVILVEILR